MPTGRGEGCYWYKLLGPSHLEGAQGLTLLHMFLSFSVVWLFLLTVQINPFRPNPCHSVTESQSFWFSLKIFNWSTLAMGTQNFFIGTQTSSQWPWVKALLKSCYPASCMHVKTSEILNRFVGTPTWQYISFRYSVLRHSSQLSPHHIYLWPWRRTPLITLGSPIYVLWGELWGKVENWIEEGDVLSCGCSHRFVWNLLLDIVHKIISTFQFQLKLYKNDDNCIWRPMCISHVSSL